MRAKKTAAQKAAAERAALALSMRREGKLLREIGEALGGVDRERARQLVLKGERNEARLAAEVEE